MKRQLPGLSETVNESRPTIPDGVFLVRVDHTQHRWQAQKALLSAAALRARARGVRPIVSRPYCTPKAMWKLGWFLRDFLYDPELLSQNELDERALRDVVGVVKVSHTVVNGISLVNFDGFAPASQWEELAAAVRVPAQSDRGAGGKGKLRL